VGPDSSYSSDYNVWVYLVVFVALAIVPAMIAWWLVVLRDLNRRSEAGIRTAASCWHVLRYGPTAPLISAAVFLCGLPSWIFFPTSAVIHPTIGLCLMVMTGAGFIALVFSVVLWAFTSALERSISDAN
jgi:hypothetical protein